MISEEEFFRLPQKEQLLSVDQVLAYSTTSGGCRCWMCLKGRLFWVKYREKLVAPDMFLPIIDLIEE